ncbi:hypothetical protein [Mycoplasmopsis felifaucium]|uniref:Septation ring formation regulator EzrA n=1 Tax=Mycoplasmopsis felifaucium TaxID=35768 RepID=A0ABZ2RTB8_9BACT
MSNKQIIGVSILSFVILLAVIAVVVLSYYLYRNYRLSYFKKFTSKSIDEAKKFSTNRLATIARFKSVAVNKKDYIKDLNELERLNKLLEEHYSTLKIYQDTISQLVNKRQIKQASKQFKIYKTVFKKYSDYKDKFNGISANLNKHWNIIDSLSTSSLKILNETKEYLENHKSKFAHSYNNLLNDLNELISKTVNFEYKKTQEQIESVSREAVENEKRVNAFVKKMDHMANLEFAIFNQFPAKLSTFSVFLPNDDKINKLIEQIKNVQNEFLEIPYQKSLETLRKMYHSYSLIKRDYEVKSELNKFIQNIWIEFLRDYADKYKKLIQVANNILSFKMFSFDIHKIKDLKLWLINFNDIFKELNKKIQSKKSAGFLEIQSFIESYNNIIYEANYIINEFNDLVQKIIYDNFYYQMTEYLYLAILKNRFLLDDSSENQKLITDFVNLKIVVSNLYKTEKAIDFTNETWKEWNKQLIFLYKIIQKQYVYKAMYEKLVRKASKHLTEDNLDFIEILDMADNDAKSYKYKNAYRTILNFIMKGNKKYVR